MNEAVAVASEMRSELKRYVNTVERNEAAETVVSILIDNDCDVDDIKDTFKGDSDIKRALTAYIDNDKSYTDEDDEDDGIDAEEDYHEDDWEN
jgi:hypothetical protein